MLIASDWTAQSKGKLGLHGGLGQAVRESQTDIGQADYMFFVDQAAVGVIEAKREEAGQSITSVEDHTKGYSIANLKWIKNSQPLPFLYESTGVIIRFTDTRDPKLPSREILVSRARKR